MTIEGTLSMFAIAISVTCVIIVLVDHHRFKEPYPSLDQLRRFLKLLITGKYEEPKKKETTVK